jgi:predicted secreted Zn-dependent protease
MTVIKNNLVSFLIVPILLSSVYSVQAANEFEKFENASIPASYEKLQVRNNSHFSTSGYDIYAHTADELGEQLLENAPSSGRNIKSVSLLQLSINWNINDQQNEDYCELIGVDINSETDFIVPNWVMDEDVSDENAEIWYNFLEALTAYQEKNKRIINKHLDRFENKIREIKPAVLCSELEATINGTGNSVIESINQEINALQYETQNGSLVKNLKYPVLKAPKQEQNKTETVKEEKKPETSKDQKKPEASKEQKKPEASKDQKKPEVSKDQKKPEVSKDQKKPEASKEQKKPEASKEEKKPETSKEQKKPEAVKEEKKPEAPKEQKKTEEKKSEPANEQNKNVAVKDQKKPEISENGNRVLIRSGNKNKFE